MTVASMIASVSRLDDASQTVRLSFGLLDDGIRKGKSATPAVAIVPNGNQGRGNECQTRSRAQQDGAKRTQIGDRYGQPQSGIKRDVCEPAAGNKCHGFVQRIGRPVMRQSVPRSGNPAGVTSHKPASANRMAKISAA